MAPRWHSMLKNFENRLTNHILKLLFISLIVQFLFQNSIDPIELDLEAGNLFYYLLILPQISWCDERQHYLHWMASHKLLFWYLKFNIDNYLHYRVLGMPSKKLLRRRHLSIQKGNPVLFLPPKEDQVLWREGSHANFCVSVPTYFLAFLGPFMMGMFHTVYKLSFLKYHCIYTVIESTGTWSAKMCRNFHISGEKREEYNFSVAVAT